MQVLWPQKHLNRSDAYQFLHPVLFGLKSLSPSIPLHPNLNFLGCVYTCVHLLTHIILHDHACKSKIFIYAQIEYSEMQPMQRNSLKLSVDHLEDPSFNLCPPLHLHPPVMTAVDLTAEINIRSYFSPRKHRVKPFSWEGLLKLCTF